MNNNNNINLNQIQEWMEEAQGDMERWDDEFDFTIRWENLMPLIENFFPNNHQNNQLLARFVIAALERSCGYLRRMRGPMVVRDEDYVLYTTLFHTYLVFLTENNDNLMEHADYRHFMTDLVQTGMNLVRQEVAWVRV